MNYPTAFQLLNPISLFAISLGFYLMYRHGRKQQSTKYWSMGYFACGVAFLLDISRPLLDPVLASIVINFLFILVPTCLGLGFAHRYNKAAPVRLFVLGGIITMAVLGYYWTVEPSMIARAVWMNTCVGLLFLLVLTCMSTKNSLLIDKLLFGLVVVLAVQIIARAPLLIIQTGETLTAENYTYSSFALSMRFFNSVLSMTLAVLLFFAALRDLVLELKRHTNLDPLTGLRNRRGIVETADNTITLQERKKRPLSLVIIDIDFFRKLNESHGKSVGDEVLKTMAGIISDNCERGDKAGRYAGGTFCILLPGSNLRKANQFAETLRGKIENHGFNGLPANASVTASIGVSEWVPGESFNALFERADAALYYAKDAGRNVVESFGTPEMTRTVQMA